MMAEHLIPCDPFAGHLLVFSSVRPGEDSVLEPGRVGDLVQAGDRHSVCRRGATWVHRTDTLFVGCVSSEGSACSLGVSPTKVTVGSLVACAERDVVQQR
jgi:hypothetical protein